MGNQESKAAAATKDKTLKGKGQVTETLVPVRRMSVDRIIITGTLPTSKQCWNKRVYTTILETAFTGKWSNITPKGALPKARIGHFSVYSKELHKAFVGYGVSPSGEMLNDLWSLDLDNYQWKRIQLKGEKIDGRIGASATIGGTTIYVFGGSVEQKYVTDLHTINIETGEVNFLATSDPDDDSSPTARATPVFQFFKERLIVWGGFNGAFPTDLYSLDLQTLSWTRKDPKIAGRAGIPWIVVDGQILCYGGSKGGEMLSIKPDTMTIAVIPCTGILPPSENTGFQMVSAENYIFFFGGKANTEWTFLYACDIEKMSWFVFDMKPDGETVKVDDGHISDLGLFMLPRLHTFGAAYSEKNKALLGFFGFPQIDPPPIYAISIGEALSILRQSEDMKEALRETGEMHKGEKVLPGIVKAARAFEEPEAPINDM